MKRLPLSIVAWAAAAVVAGCTSPPEPPAPLPEKQADLVTVEGPVELERAGARAVPAVVGPLFGDDVVSTGAGGRAVLRSRDGQELELGPTTRFRVARLAGRVSLELEEGAITFVHEGDGGLELTTRYGKAVLRGRGRVDVSDGGAHLAVSVGTITFADDDGGTATVTPGTRLTLSMGAFSIVEEPEDLRNGPAAAPVDAGTRELLVRSTAERGTVLLQPPGAAKLSAAADGPLLPGTAFRVSRDGAGRLDAPGLVVQLAGGATGQVGRVQRGPDGSTLDLALSAGRATALLEGGEVGLSLQSHQLRAKGAATVELAAVKSGREVALEVLAGSVELTSGSKRVNVSTGQRLSFAATGTGAVRERARPQLVLPLGKRVLVHGAADVALALSDEPQRVEVAADEAFERPLVIGVAWGTLRLPNTRQTLFVRTSGLDGGVGERGSVAFQADKATPRASPASETISETGQRATLYFEREVPALTFVFAAREGAKRYRLKVFEAANLKVPRLELEVPGPRCSVEPGALPEGSYVWYAEALTEQGAELGDGATNRFDLQFENARASLTISRPAPGEQASAGAVASGVAPLNSRLTVNGLPVSLDSRGRFSVPVGRVKVVTFRLTTHDGAERYWVRRLR